MATGDETIDIPQASALKDLMAHHVLTDCGHRRRHIAHRELIIVNTSALWLQEVDGELVDAEFIEELDHLVHFVGVVGRDDNSRRGLETSVVESSDPGGYRLAAAAPAVIDVGWAIDRHPDHQPELFDHRQPRIAEHRAIGCDRVKDRAAGLDSTLLGISDRLAEPVFAEQQRLTAMKFERERVMHRVIDEQVHDATVGLDGHTRRTRRRRIDIAVGALEIAPRSQLERDHLEGSKDVDELLWRFGGPAGQTDGCRGHVPTTGEGRNRYTHCGQFQ